MEWVYYTGVKLRPVTLLLLVVLLASCDRGSKPRMINNQAPDFTVHDSDRTVAFRDFKGKPLVLNFWATWCPPCIEEMPSLIQLQRRVAPRIAVLAISIDEDEQQYHQFLKKYGIDPQMTVRDPAQKTSTLYGTTGWPETFIIDASGTIRRKFVSAVDWNRPDILDYLNHL